MRLYPGHDLLLLAVDLHHDEYIVQVDQARYRMTDGLVLAIVLRVRNQCRAACERSAYDLSKRQYDIDNDRTPTRRSCLSASWL